MIQLRIQEALDAKPMSAYRLAKEVGISDGNLAKWRKNRLKHIDLATLQRIADVLECNPIDLFTVRPATDNAPQDDRA